MARAVSQWAWKLFRLGQGDDTSNPDNLPFILPSRRPVTPPSSRASPTFVIPNGPFFERLPLELRQKILIDVFGNRQLHLDLEFATPRLPGQRLLHTDYYLNSEDIQEPAPARNEPEVWQWRSCICHRNPPPGSSNRSYFNALWTDQCLDGRAFACHLWPGESPEKCHVDVMGWLLSCRQAYLEGINILYSTNTFIVDTRLLVQNFGRLLPPQSLALVTSLELTWEVTKPPAYDSSRPMEWPDPVDLPFNAIKNVFPRLRVLHVSLYGDMISTGEADIDDPNTRGVIEIREQVIFGTIEHLLASTDLRQLYLELNWTLWTQLRAKEGRKEGYRFEEKGCPGPRFWRSLPGSKRDDTCDRGCWVIEGRHGW